MTSRRPLWYVEFPLLVGGYLLFGLVRAAIDRGDRAATEHSHAVERLERVLHLAVERRLNDAVLGHPAAMYATGYFYRLCILAIPAILIWLFLARPGQYRFLRTVLVVTTLMDLPLVWLFPAAPPRLALDGIVDYMAAYDILGGAAAREPGHGLNVHAAMPSMHIAWTTWCAYATWTALRERSPRARWLAWLFPLITAFVVLVTGHHYVLDILAGIALVAVVVGVARWLSRRSSQVVSTHETNAEEVDSSTH
jgi:PAP2 superfamily protein